MQEVVSLGDEGLCHPNELAEKAGMHLKPEEWHHAILSPENGSMPILLDTRNVYETSIGHFEAVSSSASASARFQSGSYKWAGLERISTVLVASNVLNFWMRGPMFMGPGCYMTYRLQATYVLANQ